MDDREEEREWPSHDDVAASALGGMFWVIRTVLVTLLLPVLGLWVLAGVLLARDLRARRG